MGPEGFRVSRKHRLLPLPMFLLLLLVHSFVMGAASGLSTNTAVLTSNGQTTVAFASSPASAPSYSFDSCGSNSTIQTFTAGPWLGPPGSTRLNITLDPGVGFIVACCGQTNVTCTPDIDKIQVDCKGGNAISCELKMLTSDSGLLAGPDGSGGLSQSDPFSSVTSAQNVTSSNASCKGTYSVNCSLTCNNASSGNNDSVCVPHCTCLHDEINLSDVITYAYPEIKYVDQIVTVVIYCIGFPGNVLSFLVWIQRRMRHSSGIYLAALAVDDFIFLSLHVVFEMHSAWGSAPLDTPVVCQAFPVLFLTSQYLGPLLVLGFTTERYISICHPFKREKYCTVRRAKLVVGILVLLAMCLSLVQGYFYNYTPGSDGNPGSCGPRPNVAEGDSTSLLIIWNLSIEILIFALAPLAILVLNIMVIATLRRLSRMEQVTLHHGGHSQRTSASTLMLLAVSFYLILTTLPVTIIYNLFYEFEMSPYKTFRQPTWELVKVPEIKRYINYTFVQACIKEIGITHYAFNVIIYITTGKAFRVEVKRLFVKVLCGKVSMSISKEYSSLRSSLRRDGSKTQTTALGGKSMYVSINGHSTATTTTTVVADAPHHPLPLPPSTTIISEPHKPSETAPLTSTTTSEAAPTSTSKAGMASNHGEQHPDSDDFSETNV